MVIYINDEKREVEAAITISQLLEILAIPDSGGMALAINNRVIPKNSWDTTILEEESKVLLIRATRGG